jgi:hypothetical protein
MTTGDSSASVRSMGGMKLLPLLAVSVLTFTATLAWTYATQRVLPAPLSKLCPAGSAPAELQKAHAKLKEAERSVAEAEGIYTEFKTKFPDTANWKATHKESNVRHLGDARRSWTGYFLAVQEFNKAQRKAPKSGCDRIL